MMQHQYWVTKKTVLKKLGTKEDECIVSSDAELDAKLELFRSISDSCLQLQRVLDQYQERLCVLAQEENSLGKFLRDAGKGADPAGKHMVSAGKAISYSGQQRLSVRGPLLRLYNEVETFRGRAVSDMRATVSAMEKARTEYRAALSWMKSTSAQLDPDTGRGLDNFRKAQRQVRESKKLFDKLTLDVLQKIDLLAAARCNMFSHVLANYQTSYLKFTTKVAQTLLATADTMTATPQYEFSILTELSQKLGEGEEKKEEVVAQDKDQMLFFQDEYKDDPKNQKPEVDSTKTDNEKQSPSSDQRCILEDSSDTSSNLIDAFFVEADDKLDGSGVNSDLAGLDLDCGGQAGGSVLTPLQLMQDLNTNLPESLLAEPMKSESVLSQPIKSESLLSQPIKSESLLAQPMKSEDTKPSPSSPKLPMKPKKEDRVAWFKLFAELDPLANPDSIPGSNNNQSHAA